MLTTWIGTTWVGWAQNPQQMYAKVPQTCVTTYLLYSVERCHGRIQILNVCNSDMHYQGAQNRAEMVSLKRDTILKEPSCTDPSRLCYKVRLKAKIEDLKECPPSHWHQWWHSRRSDDFGSVQMHRTPFCIISHHVHCQTSETWSSGPDPIHWVPSCRHRLHASCFVRVSGKDLYWRPVQ